MRLLPAGFVVLSMVAGSRAGLLIAAGVLCFIAIQPLQAVHAQPPIQMVGETVANRASPEYRFERFTIEHANDQAKWRVWVAVPKKPAPAEGFPSFWMLDGNGALMEFDDSLLRELGTQDVPQVLVFITHDSNLRFESRARYRDYTPAVVPEEFAEKHSDQRGGGADVFLNVILDQIRPRVKSIAKLDPHAQAIWGHSLGGIFVLNALFKQPGTFETYIAGSPSLWWGRGQTARDFEKFKTHFTGQSARVIILQGGMERKDRGGRHRDMNDPRVAAHLERLKSVPPDAAAKLAKSLEALSGLDVTYREFPGLSHGPMFRASLMAGLRSVAGIADHSVSNPRGEEEP